MIGLFKKYKEIILYIVFGVFTTVVNILIFNLCRNGAGLSIAIANGIAWFWAVFFAYITNRKWVFESNGNSVLKEVFYFYLARVATLVIETIILYVFIDMIGMGDLVSKVFSNIVVIVLNYVFSKLFVFRK